MANPTASADGAPAPDPNDEIPVETGNPLRDERSAAAAESAASQPAADASAASESQDDDTEKPAVSREPQKVPEWVQKKMAADAFELREAKRRLKELEDQRQSGPAQPTAEDAAQAQRAAPTGGYASQEDFNRAVQQEADNRMRAQIAAQEQASFDAACNAAYQAGKSNADFGSGFDAAVQNLQQVGFMNRDMLDLVVATDEPARVLYELGSDPDKAAQILQMTPAKRAIEIAKMAAAAPARKAPEAVSKAPRPVKPVEGSARPNGDPADDDDDETWFAKRNAQLRQRGAA